MSNVSYKQPTRVYYRPQGFVDSVKCDSIEEAIEMLHSSSYASGIILRCEEVAKVEFIHRTDVVVTRLDEPEPSA